jgi:hypothetical protein
MMTATYYVLTNLPKKISDNSTMDKKRKKKYDWIVLKYDVHPNLLICERCNKNFTMPSEPISFGMIMAIMNTFAKEHKRCKTSEQKGTERYAKLSNT